MHLVLAINVCEIKLERKTCRIQNLDIPRAIPVGAPGGRRGGVGQGADTIDRPRNNGLSNAPGHRRPVA